MSAKHRIAWIGIVASTLLGCAPSTKTAPASGDAPTATAAANATNDSLVQFSLLSVLAADDYAGSATLHTVLANGDFGIGTFDHLDGEMIVLDGKVYQALADGTVRPADLDGTTPFAAVTFFQEDGHIDNLSAATLDNLNEQLDAKLPRRNSPYAIRITGDFAALTLRSVAAQTPPYRPLVEVVKQQTTWQHQNQHGTLVGLRCPAWMGTLNVSGYHWHFLSDDHKVGGHVLACEFPDAAVSFDECDTLVIRIPQSKEFDEFDARDVTEQDVDKIERLRAPVKQL